MDDLNQSCILVEGYKPQTRLLVQEPDPFLKNRSQNIHEVNDEIRMLMMDMYVTMKKNRGIGLAAVQVGVLKNVIVIDIPEVTEIPLFMANLKIDPISKNTSFLHEGCLSVPGVSVNISRSNSIKISYLDQYNQSITSTILENNESDPPNILAKCLQHELDHVFGKVILDYLPLSQKAFALERVQKAKKMQNQN